MNTHAVSEDVTELFDAPGKFVVSVGREHVDRHVSSATGTRVGRS